MKLPLLATLFAFSGTAGAQSLLVPNGNFEALDDSLTWVSATGPGVVVAFPDTGGSGNNGGYATLDTTNGEWAVLVNPPEPGNTGGGLDIANYGLVGGGPITMTMDMINLSGTGTGGLKIEAWAGNALIGNTGDVPASGNSTEWATYTWNWTLPVGTEKLIIVPLWGANSIVGYDNIGIPEPSAFALIGGLFALGLIVRRRR